MSIVAAACGCRYETWNNRLQNLIDNVSFVNSRKSCAIFRAFSLFLLTTALAHRTQTMPSTYLNRIEKAPTATTWQDL